MNNIHHIITSYNKTYLNIKKREGDQTKSCNCRNKTLYPLQDECLQEDVMYLPLSCKVIQGNKIQNYIGVTENELEARL